MDVGTSRDCVGRGSSKPAETVVGREGRPGEPMRILPETRPGSSLHSAETQEAEMARAGLLWLLGIPIPILLLMWALGWLH